MDFIFILPLVTNDVILYKHTWTSLVTNGSMNIKSMYAYTILRRMSLRVVLKIKSMFTYAILSRKSLMEA
jgi:hypothetical protein